MCAEPVDETVRNDKYLLFVFQGILLKSLWPMTRLNYFSSKQNLKITATPTNRNCSTNTILTWKLMKPIPQEKLSCLSAPLAVFVEAPCHTWLLENCMCEAILLWERKIELDICNITTSINNIAVPVSSDLCIMNSIIQISPKFSSFIGRKLAWTIPTGFVGHTWNDLSDCELSFAIRQ